MLSFQILISIRHLQFNYCIIFQSIPADGITIFGSQLHTHLTGIGVFTRHIRDGIELNELNRDDHYSTHFQEIRRLKKPVKVLPVINPLSI